jgi:hypothetical protein
MCQNYAFSSPPRVTRDHLFPFLYDGWRCQVVAFVGGTLVRVRFRDATPLMVDEGMHEAVVSCLALKPAALSEHRIDEARERRR